MRWAVISDIRGNIWTLDAVINAAKKRGSDRFLNLGDSAYGPLEPARTFAMLASLACTLAGGNEDRLLSSAADALPQTLRCSRLSQI